MTVFTPPPTFEQIPSTLEGITVWRPRPKEMAPDVPQTFTCPQCGASTKFDVAAGGVSCEYCGYTSKTQATTVGKRAEEFEFTLETLEHAEQGWGVDRRNLVCDNCGATVSLAEGALTATCPFCASNKVNVRPAPTDQLRPRFLVPFKLKSDSLQTRLEAWLGTGWFHPGNLASTAGVDRFTGVYFPFWTFDANIAAGWKAELGYERQESYYDHSDKSWKTRTVIDWRWESGQVRLKMDDLLVTGTSRASRLLLERLKPFNLSELVAYAPEFLAGWQAQAYDVTLPQAWDQGKAAMREHAKKASEGDAHQHSKHVRNFGMTADFADETWRYILLPVYLAAYPFDGKVYQVMANGQTGAIAGQKPVAWWKIWLAIAALLIPGAGLMLVGIPLLLLGGAGIVVSGFGGVLLIPGGIFAYQIYRKAVESEAL